MKNSSNVNNSIINSTYVSVSILFFVLDSPKPLWSDCFINDLNEIYLEDFTKTNSIFKELKEGSEKFIEIKSLSNGVVFNTYNTTIINSGGKTESIKIELDDKAKISIVSRDIITNFFYLASRLEAKSIIIQLSKKCSDYGMLFILAKILQGLMTVGFKSDTTSNNSKYIKNLKIELNKNEVFQEIEF